MEENPCCTTYFYWSDLTVIMKLCDMRDGTLDRRYTCNDYVHDNCSIIRYVSHTINSAMLCIVHTDSNSGGSYWPVSSDYFSQLMYAVMLT